MNIIPPRSGIWRLIFSNTPLLGVFSSWLTSFLFTGGKCEGQRFHLSCSPHGCQRPLFQPWVLGKPLPQSMYPLRVSVGHRASTGGNRYFEHLWHTRHCLYLYLLLIHVYLYILI